MKKVSYGNTTGLRNTQIKRIENLYTFKTPPEAILSKELAIELAAVSHDIRRQMGVLIDRNGRTIFVIVGEPHRACKINCVTAHNSIVYQKLKMKDEQTHGQKET